MAGFEEGGEEAHANVAVGAGEEDVHGEGSSWILGWRGGEGNHESRESPPIFSDSVGGADGPGESAYSGLILLNLS
ncbi:MAG: hypothetical protein ACJAQT_004884 [Akkermansiaceae bacterium]